MTKKDRKKTKGYLTFLRKVVLKMAESYLTLLRKVTLKMTSFYILKYIPFYVMYKMIFFVISPKYYLL